MIFCCCLFQRKVHAQDTSFKAFDSPVPGSEFTIKMIPVNGGTFRIGNYAEAGKKNPVETKDVKLSDFWIGAYEITHDQFGVFYKDETITQGSKVDAVTRPTAQYIDLSWNMGKDGGSRQTA